MRLLTVLAASIALCSHSISAQVNDPEWARAHEKAKTAISKLSLQEKVDLLTGIGLLNGNCSGSTIPIPTISHPGLCLQDGPLGVRSVDLVSGFPAGINAAATFDKSLMRARGVAIGEEFRGKGIHAHLGPNVNMMRAPTSGRAWEGYGGDPYLSGEAAYEHIKGVQSVGVQAVVKHLMNNEQEHSRASSSSNVDDRTQHEVYLHPFLRSVQANVASVMCSYNQVNGTHACENDRLMNGFLKHELGFQGYVVSDWLGTHSTSANQGLDMEMPGGIISGLNYFGGSLKLAVQTGKVNQTRLDDMVGRVLAGYYLLNQDNNYPPVNFNTMDANSSFNQHVNVQGNHGDLIRQIGQASTVLLKNTKNALPLQKPASLAIIGSGAGSNPDGINSCSLQMCNKGVLATGWGSGSASFPYLITPLDALTNRSAIDNTNITSSISDSTGPAAKAALGRSAAIVFVTADSGEGFVPVEGNAGDRNDLDAWHNGNALVKAVAAVNPNTIVVVNSVGPIVMETWINNSNVTAVVWSGLPGQEAGNSLTDILYGVYNPSGRLPYTIGKRQKDYPAQVNTDFSLLFTAQIPYKEGLMIDYRHFDKNDIAPRFEFGFGLSYTTFQYSNLKISGSLPPYTPSQSIGSSLDPSLHAQALTISLTIKNAGNLDGHEVPQLYLTLPASTNSPPYLLKGFDCVLIKAGQSAQVTMNVSRYDLSIWNVVKQNWEVPSGVFVITIGASSRDRRLSGNISL